MKKIQARFFRGNVLAQTGHFLTKEEVDKMREKVLINSLEIQKKLLRKLFNKIKKTIDLLGLK
jgi:hypothetical protein